MFSGKCGQFPGGRNPTHDIWHTSHRALQVQLGDLVVKQMCFRTFPVPTHRKQQQRLNWKGSRVTINIHQRPLDPLQQWRCLTTASIHTGKQPEVNGSNGLHRVLPETFIWLLSHAQQLCKQPCSVLVRMVNKRPWPRSGRALSFSLTSFGFGMKRLHKVSFSQTTQVVTCCVMAVDGAAVTEDRKRPFLLCENWWWLLALL